MAISGQMIAQDKHAVQRASSKQSAKGTPWRLNSSLDITSIFSGHAETHSVQPLQRSRSNSGLPLDTEMLLYREIYPQQVLEYPLHRHFISHILIY